MYERAHAGPVISEAKTYPPNLHRRRKEPRVSVGLTVYNGERYIESTILSFLEQEFSDFELIVSDNASTDGTGDIAIELAARDTRIRYYRNHRNVGLAENHNIVFRLSRGEYFKWAAADDVCLPRYLSRCVECLDSEQDAVLAYPRTRFIDAAGNELDIQDPGWDIRVDRPADRLRVVLSARHWMNAIVGLVRADGLRRTRLMPPYNGGDYRVLAELSIIGKIFEVPEVLFLRRIHPDCTSQHGTAGATPDPDWLARCWTGEDVRMYLPQWRLMRDYWSIVFRSPVSLAEKYRLWSLVMRQIVSQRGRLTSEIYRELKRVVKL